MYTLKLNDRYLSDEEARLLTNGLDPFDLDDNVWKVFTCLFRSATRTTIPLILRVYENGALCAAAIIIRCRQYGRSLFRNRLLARLMDSLGIPCHIWIKFGCCMDMMSNPGFAADPAKAKELHTAMSRYLRDHTFLTIISDFTRNSEQHEGAEILPAMPHAAIRTTGMSSINDYLGKHTSLRKKLNVFRKVGGTVDIIQGALGAQEIKDLRRCFLSTAEKSVFYLPYEDLYLASALTTSAASVDNVYHFVARLDGKFIGYQAAIWSGKCLNALHGAFDRTLQTTHHAYDVLIVKMIEFAIEKGAVSIDIGAVMNETKQQMVNHVSEMSYFLGSKYRPVQTFFSMFLKMTRIQGSEQMKYRSPDQGKTDEQ